jgi:predicted nucleic acid-binding protein
VVGAYFLDSSALVKRYVAEIGTAWIRGITDPAAHNQLIIARITCVELVSALARREREGVLSPETVAKAANAFRYDLDMQYQVVELDRALAEAASQLVFRHPLRAYDAVQLASAQRIQPAFAQATTAVLTFLAADDGLLTVAKAEGLLTDNPNRHP